MRYFPIALAVCALVGCKLTTVRADESPPRTQRHLEWIAAQLPYLSASEFAFDRDEQNSFNLPKAKKLLAAKMRVELKKVDYAVADLLPQLGHPDPKVRTLALAILYDKEDPRLLPLFVPLLRDKAQTFSAPEEISCGFGSRFRPMIKQTVAEFASNFIQMYVGSASKEDFAKYWAVHKDRRFCANWFQIQLTRAAHGTFSNPEDRTDRIRAIRKRIDQVPEPERTWILLYLHGGLGGDVVISNDELTKQCKNIGPERLMDFLQGQILSNDPDLQTGLKDSYLYPPMIMFVLQRASGLLRPQDADTLFASSERGTTAWWAIAAAELYGERDKAWATLHRAEALFKRIDQANERAELAAAYWRLIGPATSNGLIEWFYKESSAEHVYPNARSLFLRGIAAVRPFDNRKLVLDIIQDKRFGTLETQSLAEMVVVIRLWGEVPSIDLSTLQNQHRDNPAAWRAAIVASIPRWAQ